jgi:hypothetical protein
MTIVKLYQHTITHQNGGLHAEKHPAMMHTDYQEWSLNGVYHREDGPARLFRVAPDGKKYVLEWWQNGKFILSDILPLDVFEKYWFNGVVQPDHIIGQNK